MGQVNLEILEKEFDKTEHHLQQRLDYLRGNSFSDPGRSGVDLWRDMDFHSFRRACSKADNFILKEAYVQLSSTNRRMKFIRNR